MNQIIIKCDSLRSGDKYVLLRYVKDVGENILFAKLLSFKVFKITVDLNVHHIK